MERINRKVIYWTPRVLSMLVVIYAAKNVPDYARSGTGIWDSLIAILKHLIPACILALLIFLSWRREWIGGVTFGVLAVLRLAKDLSQSQITHLWLVLIGATIAVLWVLSWKHRDGVRGRRVIRAPD